MSNPGLSARRGIFGWWLNLTAPPKPREILPVAARERLRKAELTSYSILAVFAFLLALVSNSLADPATAQAVAFMAVGLFFAAILNRFGRTRVAAFLVPILLMIVIALAVVGAVNLDVILFPAYDLFALPIFLTSLIINRRAPWFFSMGAIAFIAIDFFLQPHGLITVNSPDIGRATNFDSIAYYTQFFGAWGMINRHIGLNLFAAFFGWLGARSQEFSILRADRAEELAELERRELERTRELEEGVRQLLAVHVHLANGDFNVRAPAIRNSLLWQIGSSLNNLVARLSRMAQADFVLRRTQEESNRLVEALFAIRSGRQPLWPAPSQTPLDRLVEVLRNMFSVPSGQQLPPGAAGAPGVPGAGGPAGHPRSSVHGVPDRLSSPYPGNQPGANPVPDWMQALMPGQGAPGGMPPQQPSHMGQMSQMPPYEGAGPGMPDPASAYGSPVSQGYSPQPPSGDVNPWSLEPSEPLGENNLPDWLRQPNQE